MGPRGTGDDIEATGATVDRRVSPSGALEVGDLVRTAAFGVGRVRSVGDVVTVVRYFRGPSRSPFVDHEHPMPNLSPAELRAHTRVYVYDGRRWRIGRVDGPHPQADDSYLIAFPNQEGGVLPVESFDVRWDLPVDNPYEVLEAVGGDSPLVYGARLALLAEWTHQRAAAIGVEGLLLGSVELHRHQLAVVRRVAADPIKRYLLADEVGLGKTIEASALIWQFLSGRPTGSVL
ncbi:MAG TPA: hypothetical protein VLJ88_13665, partial [Propionibacteriaceae bacterium]|nr:hypothetical protein [Propionibacteriaceae bacterium]